MKVTPRYWLLCASVLGAGFFPGVTLAAAGQAVSSGEGVITGSVVHENVTNKKAAKKKTFKSLHVEEVTVTGSYLTTSKNSNANPVQTISNKQIMQTGITNIGDFLQRMPSVGSSGTSNAETNGTGGVSCTDLRNLGQNRVLVLIDGKRTALNAQSSCVDMNTIPVQLIENIEILKDGSSELYGSDAISGVINMKLRHNLDKGGLMIRGGISGRGDGKTGMLSAYKGWNFGEGRGNITLFGSYNTTAGIMQKNRSWANPVFLGWGVNNTPVVNSGFSSKSRWMDKEGNPLPGGGVSASQRYPYGKDQMLTNSVKAATLYGDAHYDFNRHFTLYSNVLYSHRNTLSQMAPEPYAGGGGLSRTLPGLLTLPKGYGTSETNPYYDRDDATLGGRRYTELGLRRYENASDTYTVKAGLKGDVVGNWKYDSSFTYGRNEVLDHFLNIGSYQKLLNVYGLSQKYPGHPDSPLVYNTSACPSFGCSSPFQPLSANAAAYMNANTNQHSYSQLRDWNLRIHNNRLFTSPWEHGGHFGIALGMEHRSEQLSQNPDPLIISGQSLSNYAVATGGGFRVTEGYLEGNWNLLHNALLAKDLTLDAQSRVSGYNAFGVTKNWKASLNWMPTRDVHFRGTLGTSFRNPNVQEAYLGQLLSFNMANDPCDMNQIGTYASLGTVAARCAQQHINSQTFTQQGSGQVPTLMGGNAKLRPETGRTYTFGVELTPHWIKRFSASVEYWHTGVSNMIGALPTQYILDTCYIQGNLCGAVHRYSNGQISTVNAFNTNLGSLRTAGIDFDLDYSLPLTEYDVLTLSNNLQQVVSYQMQQIAGGQWYNYDGRLLFNNIDGMTPGQGVPRLRDYATVSWRHNGFNITYMMQYMSGMVWNDGSRDQTAADGLRHSTPGMFEHDLSVNYRVGKWNLGGGINNITNKRPPFVATSIDNSAASLYGNFYMGRYFFLQTGREF